MTVPVFLVTLLAGQLVTGAAASDGTGRLTPVAAPSIDADRGHAINPFERTDASPAQARQGAQGRRRQSTADAAASIAFTSVAYDADGRTVAIWNYARSSDFKAYFFNLETLCRPGGESAEHPADAAFGWEIAGKFLSRTSTEIVVHLDWRRAFEDGKPVSGPAGSLQLTLRPGDRTPIDHVSAVPVAACRGVGATLNVGFRAAGMPNLTGGGMAADSPAGGARGAGSGRPSPMGSAGAATRGDGLGAPARGGGGSGGGFRGTGGGGGGVSGAARGAPATSGSAGDGRSSVSFPAESGNGVTTAPTGVSIRSELNPSTLVTLTAELWLVQRLPNGQEQSQPLTIRTTPGDGTFQFAPLVVSVTRGLVEVDVKGFLQAQRQADGTAVLEVGVLRRVRTKGSPPTAALGGSTRQVEMPQPGDVVSFQMPGAEVPLDGHQFSLRVRFVR